MLGHVRLNFFRFILQGYKQRKYRRSKQICRDRLELSEYNSPPGDSMTSRLKIRDASGWTMFIFGVLAFLLGFVGLIRPEWLLSILGFNVLDRAERVAGDYTLVFLIASSMASFNIGAYYILAALN